MKHSPELPPLATIDSEALTGTTGGMQWENFRASYNVEDRRPGAGTKLQQRARTDAWNRERGYPTWADMNPIAPPTPKR